MVQNVQPSVFGKRPICLTVGSSSLPSLYEDFSHMTWAASHNNTSNLFTGAVHFNTILQYEDSTKHVGPIQDDVNCDVSV